MTRVSIIIPIIRSESAKRCINAIIKNAGVPRDNYEIVTAEDVAGVGCPEMVRKLTNKTRFKWVMFLGDDCEPEKDFLLHAIAAAETLPMHYGVVGLNTQDDRENAKPNDTAHWMAHKDMLHYIDGGNFFSTDYAHCWGDDELRDIAQELKLWVFAENVRIRHHHPVNGTAEWDEHHDKVYSQETHHGDYKTYLIRKQQRIRKNQGRKLAVCLPLTSTMLYANFFYSYLALDMPHYDFFIPNYPGQIDAVRNDLIRQSLHRGCTHTLMLDTDQVYHDSDMVYKLLGHDKMVVSAVVHRRYPAFDPLVLRYDSEKDAHYGVPDSEIEKGETVEVDATGTGCILYDNRVFLDIDYPWFEIKKGKHGQIVGEDIGFCKKLKAHGYQIFVDCSVKVGHLFLTEADWLKYKLYQKLKR